MSRHDENFSIVDVLMGRHQHQAQVKITAPHRIYCNYRINEASLDAELKTAGRHRNRDVYDDDSNEVAKTVKARGY